MTGRSRDRLDIGSAVAILALVLALAGTALALPGRNSVNSGDIKAKAVKRVDQKVSQRVDWALVDYGNDNLIASSPGAELLDDGNVVGLIDFGHSVKNRPLAATVRWDADALEHPLARHCGSSVDAISCKTSNNDRTVAVQGGLNEVVYVVVLPK